MKYQQLFLMDTDILLLLQYYMTSNLENMLSLQHFCLFGSNQYDHDLLVSDYKDKEFVEKPCDS